MPAFALQSGVLPDAEQTLDRLLLPPPLLLLSPPPLHRPCRDINEYDLYKGLYDLHLQRWFDHFEPEQTLIWSSRAFSLAPKQHLEQLVGWLGLDPAEINRRIDFVKIHERSYPDDQPMPAWLFEQLVHFYEPHKQATLQLLQKVGYLQLAEQLGAAWEEELAYTQQKLVRQAAATRR